MNHCIFLSTHFRIFWIKLKTMQVITASAYFMILLNLVSSEGNIELQANKYQTIYCNEKAVLQCNISSSTQFNVIKIYWKKDGERSVICDPTSNNTLPGFKCNYTKEILTLTILHPKPANMGKYFCSIQTNSGHNSMEIKVSLGGECTGEFSHQMQTKQLHCAFNGVYPVGTINWFHNGDNDTSKSNVTILDNADGTFNITSVLRLLDIERRYICSLWLLKNGQYIKKKEFKVPADMTSRQLGRSNTLHCSPWTHLLAGLVFSLRTFMLNL